MTKRARGVVRFQPRRYRRPYNGRNLRVQDALGLEAREVEAPVAGAKAERIGLGRAEAGNRQVRRHARTNTSKCAISRTGFCVSLFVKAISATDFLRLDDLKTDYIIPNLLPEVGRVALYGVAKRGKSFLALQVAFAVCQGIPFLGHEVVKPGPVLYLQFDTPPELWQERLKKLQNAGVSIPDNLYFIHPSTQPRRVNVLDGHQAREIHDMITAKLPALVVIDVLSKIHHLNENEAQDMKPVIGHLSTLCQGRALLIVHHTAKPNLQPGAGSHSPSNAGRGSSYLGGEMDANWLLTSQGEGQGRLTIEARFAAPDKPIHLVQSDCGLWMQAAASKLGRPAKARTAYQQAIELDPALAELSTREVAERTGLSQSAIARARQGKE